ncbi:UPF0057-domain-containing protein [Plenodomus tracheiphilus IPT5]|uniref:UPF0057-domain-containing protein n=11 Tax=Pleosporineae TaxID=715340 RepID=A0A6A7B8X7_9PLEO|nr:UPF0057-domain-containing protein [Plenodomus tracheiphilus IPT5]
MRKRGGVCDACRSALGHLGGSSENLAARSGSLELERWQQVSKLGRLGVWRLWARLCGLSCHFTGLAHATSWPVVTGAASINTRLALLFLCLLDRNLSTHYYYPITQYFLVLSPKQHHHTQLRFEATTAAMPFTASDICKILLAIILPPLGVFLERGCNADFLINILLTVLGYIPGIIHALYIIFKF